ncbi:MAG: D-sedoheptulose 7-phosphate isomerase [Tannerella sp.]|jgi:D-sedoheptulose 7-phosphate isomerase|nr:D-sedoheptulose 7-phosphate isomerase [Tannerella sp.]
MKDLIRNSLEEARRTMERFVSDGATTEAIAAAAAMIANAISNGNKAITCGNGGSLCDATHFAEELTGRFRNNRRPLPAVAINDPAHITCVANDYGYDDIFAAYVEALGAEGDVLICFSTSGNSENILRAAAKARTKEMKTIAMTRRSPNRLADLADIAIAVEHDGYSDRIQEMHILAVHIIIETVEALLKQSDRI